MCAYAKTLQFWSQNQDYDHGCPYSSAEAMPGVFPMVAGGPKSGPRACTTSALPSEPSPWPILLFLKAPECPQSLVCKDP